VGGRDYMGGKGRGRLLISGPGGAAENMAIDAAILDCATADSPLTLRFYSWRQPTLSLGYFQSLADRSLHQDSVDLPVVRRGTGGGAIVHDRELTYSLFLPATTASSRTASPIYRLVHEAISQCLLDFGVRAVRFVDSGQAQPQTEPFLCFQRRTDEDLLVNRYKILGSAQRRGRGGVLQHGSLLLATSQAAPQLPGINELSSRCVAANQLFNPIAKKLSELFQVQWEPGELSENEQTAAAGVILEKFSAERWLNRR
jgi:lipoyl(octanoyl) transferase